MVNHIRTLLLNRGREGCGPDYPGEEYVPAAFKPRRLDSSLKAIHGTIFGTNPDRLFLNFRLRQILTLLHSGRFNSLALTEDSRITYWPFDAVFSDLFKTTITPVGHALPLPYFGGTHTCDDGAGRSEAQWRIQAISGPTAQIERQYPYREVSRVEFASSGLSAPILLPGSNLSIRLTASLVGKEWLIRSRAKPGAQINFVISQAIDALGEGGVRALLFASGYPQLPDVWQNGTTDAPKHEAFLLALARAIERATAK